ncbi:right-handed parallel beta-helix repeat-containing protein [Runella limosa]|uniref:right-handed parallel beta-helix repeat-containing protein n=2 Tax=Runella limosa TaxID=370978 RepID=UPI00048BE014|nr:right-handed parallel beta-helix repeat-containing protein [Runella limosa]
MKNFLLLLSCWLLASTAYATRYYVKTDGNNTNDGQSWNAAFATLQKALEATTGNNDEIWVAKGTYYPTVRSSSSNSRSVTFAMKNGVAIYGGFAGTENALADRVSTLIHSTNKTVLSGDVDMDGILDSENAFQVIRNESLNSTARIDGFTVSDGYANGATTRHFGGGMYNAAASPTVSNCRFINNSAESGGGMYNIASSPTVTNCSFIENTATDTGAGMYTLTNSSPLIFDCLFSKNTASSFGGGTYILNSSPQFTRCIFSGNTSAEGGGAVIDTSSPIFTNCSFSGNKATRTGGAISMSTSNPVITNCSLSGNQAADGGGGIYAYSSRLSTIKLRNSIIWGNNTDELFPAVSGGNVIYTFTNTIVKGMNNGSGFLDGTQDPLFVSQPDYNAAPTALGDLRLQACSPALNVGDNTVFNAGQTPDLSAITTDLASNPRIFNTTVDVGAYELQSIASVLYVKSDGDDSNDGLTWSTAFQTLQRALDFACSGKQIWVAKGTYYPNSGYGGGRYVHFEMKNGVAIYGGFAGTETTLSERVAALIHTTNATILSGDIDKDGLLDSDNAYQVIRNLNVNSTAQIEGFIISDGNATGSNSYHYGGGMFNSGSSPTISNCRFTNNRADTGGGMYSGSGIVTNCTFTENYANEFGAGMGMTRSSPTLIDCLFSNNKSVYGGALDILGSTPKFIRCIFSGNSASHGGGILNTTSASIFTNCSFLGNKADDEGGGMYIAASKPLFTNCTFSGNQSPLGGGIRTYTTSSEVKMRNCLIWGNSTELYPVAASGNITYTFTNTIVKEMNNGSGFLDGTQDPLFVSQPDYNAAPTVLGDLRLQACSPALNVGDNTVFNAGQTPDLSAITTDLASNPRIFNTTVDVGAYEYQSDNSLTITANFSNPTTCGGTNGSITLSGLTANISYTVTYKKDMGNTQSVNLTANTDGQLTLTGLSAGDYTDLVATYGSCISAPTTVHLTQPSAPTIILGTIPTICQGAVEAILPFSNAVNNPNQFSIDFSVNAETAGFIDVNNVNLSGSSTSITVPGNVVAGNYTAIFTVKNSDTQCATSQPINIQVNSQPIGPTSNTKMPNVAAVCFGTGVSATFNAGSGGVGCSDDFILIIDNGTPVAYTPGSTVGTMATTSIVIQGRRANCNPNSGCSGSEYLTLASWNVNALPTASISGTTTVCQNSPAPNITFTGANATAPYTFTYKINDGSAQTVKTTSGNSVTVAAPTAMPGTFVYTLLSVSEGSSTSCSQTQTGSEKITVQGKPTIVLSTLQQTLNEGNSQTFCDTDANPVNSLQFDVSGLCVVGSPVWRVQVGSGVWSDWATNPPVSQLSNNQPHRYQAACDATCPSTYTNPIELTINYRASVPQNVSLLVDGVTVAPGETKEVCSLVRIPLTFNANCGANEVTLYSVDGGEYSSVLPTSLLDNQFHNYRVRCRKPDGTPSCVESESGVMRLKLVSIPSAPTVSLSTTSGCDATASFSGQSSCSNLKTVWYNATTNVALPSLPSTIPSETTSYYARCQTENGCVSEKSSVVTFTLSSTQVAPVITASQEVVCTGTTVRVSANCPVGSQTFWNTGVTTPSFEVSFNNVIKQSYWAKCVFAGGCQSAESARKDIYWDAFVVRLINIGESKSSVKVNDRSAWSSQFITRDGGPELGQSTQQNPTLYFVENANKVAPRYWTINADVCGLGTNGSLTFDMLAAPEMGVLRSFNTHENNAPYFMYANREGWTELYAQNHPAYGFYQDNGAGGNVYDAGLPKGLYKLGIRYWDMKGWGSIYPSTRKAQGNVLAYQEYWFRIQSKDGVGVGAAREATSDLSSRRFADARDLKPADNGSFATILPNPVTNILRLQVQANKGQAVQTTLTDASGRRVLSRQFVPETNTHQEEFRVSELPAGMYFLQVNAGDKQATLKVVKVD